MDAVTQRLVPFVLLLARISAFLAVLPVFGWQSLPMRTRAALAVGITILFATVIPPAQIVGGNNWMVIALVLVREALCGLALGLAVALVFGAVRQGGMVIRRNIGLAVAQTVDPLTNEQSHPVALILEMTFMVLFLVAGGHRLLLRFIARSYEVFPIGQTPSVGAMTEGIIQAGTLMMVFALKLAAPLLAALLLLAVLLAILARVLPEMNILLASLPLRIGLGLFMAAAIMPSLNTLIAEMGDWMSRFLAA